MANCLFCGSPFEARNYRHTYCSYACKCDARAMRRKNQNTKYTSCTKQPTVTIDMMMDAAEMLSKEHGKCVSYGQVQKELAIGKLVVSGGRIVKAGDVE